MPVTIYAALAAALLSMLATCTVQEWRHSAESAKISEQYAQDQKAAIDAALKQSHDDLKRIQSAEANALERAENLRDAARRASAESDSLRDELAELRSAIPELARVTVNQRASALTDVFGQCVAEYRELAERADRHASDVQKLREAWPGENRKTD